MDKSGLPGLSAAGVAVFFYFYVAPMQQEMTQRQRKLDALQLDIRKSQAIAQRLPQFRAEVADLEMRLETLKNVLPEEKDMGDLLRRLQTLAVQSNLTIRLQAGRDARRQAAARRVADQPAARGRYHNLALFFDRVAKFPRLIHVSGIVIKGKDRQEPDSTITAECVATTSCCSTARRPRPRPDASGPRMPPPQEHGNDTTSPDPAGCRARGEAAHSPWRRTGQHPGPTARGSLRRPGGRTSRRPRSLRLCRRRRRPRRTATAIGPRAGATRSSVCSTGARPAPAQGRRRGRDAGRRCRAEGILQNRGTFLALVQGPDGKRQYIVHPNDRFADGVVKAITADSMLILQEVNDPLSLTKQREIRKTLRAVEEVK